MGDRPTPAADLTRVQILQRVASEINSTLDLDEIYDTALRTMDELFLFHHAIILLVEPGGDTLRVAASRGYENQAIGGRVPIGTGVVGVVAKKRQLMQIGNLGQQRAYAAAQRRQLERAGRGTEVGDTVPVPGLPNAESQIAIPLVIRDELIGVFSIESAVPNAFDEHDRGLVTIVANQIASAIRNAQLYDERRRSAEALLAANASLEARVAERTAALERELKSAEDLLRHVRSRAEGPLLGESPAVQTLRDALARQATRTDPLLLIGPSGSGKEAAAHAVHDASKRKGAFIFVSCGELQTQNRHTPFGPAAVKAPERLLASKLELATNGTLFLDDVYELPQELQAELREWLSRTERPEARDEPAQPDVRVIASTTREPTGDSGSRAMFARLAGNTIKLPTLAERRADIPVLVDYFVRRHARQLGKNVEGVEAESMRRLEAYSWPGNIRELDAVISRAVLLSKGKAIRVDEELEEHRAVGSYHLVSPLGSGGMGEVWLAKHRLLARPAAVKLIRPEVTESADRDQFVRRFQREAQITAGLRSPHTVELYDFGVNDDGGFYYVMELLEGLDLHQIGTRFGPQPAERVIMLLRQACRSLAEAHALGLVHRDIKPANLFVARLGFEYDYLKVLDFGIVKDQPGSDTTLLSAQNLLPGTPAFMAPEVAFGEKVIDGRADLYSLACTAYWALTGQLLFRASTPAQMLLHHAQTAPVPPSQVSELPIPKELDAILMACLEKESAKRPASALELEERLSRVASDPWSSEQARRWWLLHAPEMVTQETLSPSTEESR